MSMPQIPVSWGELIDKITILEIKAERLPGAQARANAATELALLAEIAAAAMAQTPQMTAELRMLNQALWEIEDGLRDHERRKDYGTSFIELARGVYLNNDRRGAVKRQINLALGSALVEEKGYQPY